MIIECPCGKKKFELDLELIPEEGRLLQCGHCNKEWFYQNVEKKIIKPIEKIIKKDEIFDDETKFKQELDDLEIFSSIKDDKIEDQKEISLIENEKNTVPIKKEKILVKNDSKDEVFKKTANKNNLKIKNKKKISFINVILIFLISFVALVLIISTFESQISLFMPNVNNLLVSLFEIIKDIILFVKDLI